MIALHCLKTTYTSSLQSNDGDKDIKIADKGTKLVELDYEDDVLNLTFVHEFEKYI